MPTDTRGRIGPSGRRRASGACPRAEPSTATLAVVGVLFAGACAGGPQPPPGPGDSRGVVPDLSGTRVLVLPVQIVEGVEGRPDAELAFALEGRAPSVEWVLPEEMESAMGRSPGLDVSLRGLPVGIFLQAEVNRVGDPLYGNLRRLAALTEADAALIPVAAAYGQGEGVFGSVPLDGTVDAGSGGTVRLAAALLAVRSGRVLWFGVVEGEPGGPADPRVLASALDVLGRTLAPRGR